LCFKAGAVGSSEAIVVQQKLNVNTDSTVAFLKEAIPDTIQT